MHGPPQRPAAQRLLAEAGFPCPVPLDGQPPLRDGSPEAYEIRKKELMAKFSVSQRVLNPHPFNQGIPGETDWDL